MNPAPPYYSLGINKLRIINYNKDAPDFIGELCYSSASLVDEANEVRRHNRKLNLTNYVIGGGAG